MNSRPPRDVIAAFCRILAESSDYNVASRDQRRSLLKSSSVVGEISG